MKSNMPQTQMKREADKMLDVYIHDYLVKSNLHNSAKAFMIQGKVSPDPVAIDAPGAFLYESWSSFWDIFMSSTNDKHSESASAYIQARQTNAREQQLEMQQLQHDSAELQRRHPNHSALDGYINGMNSEGMMGLPPTSVLAMKTDEEQMKHSHSMDSEASPTLIHANRIALPKSATSHQGQLVDGNSANMPTALQQIQARSSLTTMKMARTQHSLSKQKEKLQQNNRKRKEHSSFGAHSTGTRNTMGPSPNSLDTTNNVQKSMMMYSTERTGGLAQSSILMEDMKQFGDVGLLDDDVESFLLYLQEDGENLYGTVKQSQPVEQQKETSKGFTFAECGCIKTRNDKVTSCNFSSDEKSLASAGHDNKA